MRYVSDSIFRWQPKDWLDQPLHFACGGWLAVPTIFLPDSAYWWIGIIVSIIYGARREYNQHQDSEHFINLDLIFWALGAITPSVASYTLI